MDNEEQTIVKLFDSEDLGIFSPDRPSRLPAWESRFLGLVPVLVFAAAIYEAYQGKIGESMLLAIAGSVLVAVFYLHQILATLQGQGK